MKNRNFLINSGLLLAIILLALPVNAQKLSLLSEDWNWNLPLTAVEDVPASKTAVFSATGNELTVGPWIAGKKDIRLEYQISLPVKEGTINGKFYTENLYPREANIWITYKKGNKTITELNYWFGVTDEWETFCFPVFTPLADCDTVVLSFGFHMKTHGRFHLADLRFGAPHKLPKLASQEPALTRANRPQSFKPGPFVRLEKSNDTWCLVDTNGKPFFSSASAMYGNRMTPEETYPAFHDLGFNTVANGSNLKQWLDFNEKQIANNQPTVFQFYRVNTEVGRKYDTLIDADAANPGALADATANVGGFNHAFPDPFDPRWEADARMQVRQTAEMFKDKPYFMAWMAANERSHWNLYRYVWSHNCSIQLGKFLRKKYNTIDALNKAWKSNFASFEDLLEKKPEPLVIEGRKYEDFNAFSRIVLRTFNEKILNIIHEEDPGRLVFTNRFMIHEVRGVFDNLDLYEGFDGIAVNIYPSNDVWGLDKAERQYFTLLHEKLGKPLIICEWSVPARDSHLYDNPNHLDWSYPQVMRTQQERANQAARVFANLYNMPFVVGTHWFSWADFDSKSRQSNRGLFKSNGQPWPEVQKALKDMNIRIDTDEHR